MKGVWTQENREREREGEIRHSQLIVHHRHPEEGRADADEPTKNPQTDGVGEDAARMNRPKVI